VTRKGRENISDTFGLLPSSRRQDAKKRISGKEGKIAERGSPGSCVPKKEKKKKKAHLALIRKGGKTPRHPTTKKGKPPHEGGRDCSDRV